jgi:hypothetical protein
VILLNLTTLGYVNVEEDEKMIRMRMRKRAKERDRMGRIGGGKEEK